jgi:N utilization substance protein B
MTAPRRSRAREIALQALYRLDMNPATADHEIAPFIAGRLHGGPLVPFAESLVRGVRDHRVELDALLDSRATNWRVGRMPATDRAILRIAVFEILHTSTPGPVAVNEAIELAKRYGTEGSATFVAGVLGGLLADRAAPTTG